MAVKVEIIRRESIQSTYSKPFIGNPNRSESRSYPSLTSERGITMKGGPFPNWASRIAAGSSTTSALAAVGYKLSWAVSRVGGVSTRTSGSATAIQSSDWTGYVTTGLAPPYGLQIAGSSVDNQAVTRFYNKARETISSFQGGVFLGELREALRLLKPSGYAFVRGIEDGYLAAVKKRLIKSGKRRLPASLRGRYLKERTEIAAETWLEYSFGLSPVVNDIESALRELKRYANYKKEQVRIQAGAKQVVMGQQPGGALTIPQGGVSYVVETRYESDVRYKGAVRIQTGYGVKSIKQSLGLTMDQFVPTLWELMPWSFFVDYFVNIGDIVSAVTLPRSSLAYVLRGTRWANTHTHKSGPFVANVDLNWSMSGYGNIGQSTFTRYGISRNEVVRLPVPYPVLRFPHFPRQYFNLAALVASHRRVVKAIHSQST